MWSGIGCPQKIRTEPRIVDECLKAPKLQSRSLSVTVRCVSPACPTDLEGVRLCYLFNCSYGRRDPWRGHKDLFMNFRLANA